MGDCLRTGKPSGNITNSKVNSTFHPSGVGKSSRPTGQRGWGTVKAGHVHVCRMAGKTVWSSWRVTLRSSAMGFPRSIQPFNLTLILCGLTTQWAVHGQRCPVSWRQSVALVLDVVSMASLASTFSLSSWWRSILPQQCTTTIIPAELTRSSSPPPAPWFAQTSFRFFLIFLSSHY